MTAESVRLKVEVDGGEIIVTLPGTRFKVIYQKSQDAPGLVAKSDWSADDRDAPITLNEFSALAWKVANDRARELGWIV